MASDSRSSIVPWKAAVVSPCGSCRVPVRTAAPALPGVATVSAAEIAATVTPSLVIMWFVLMVRLSTCHIDRATARLKTDSYGSARALPDETGAGPSAALHHP